MQIKQIFAFSLFYIECHEIQVWSPLAFLILKNIGALLPLRAGKWRFFI